MPKIGRRGFILGAMMAGVSLYTAGWWLFKVRPRDYSDIVLAVLRKHLGYLKVQEGDFERFASEFRPSYGNDPRVSWAGIAAPIYAWTDLRRLVPRATRFHRFEEDVVGSFLMSTDFFWRGADETREIVYMGYGPPYRRPCQNPFARFT
jgi:hypothetical protein